MGIGNYLSLYYHLVFSTKGREPFIHPDLQERLYAYIQACTKAGSPSRPWIAPWWVGLENRI